RRIGPVDDVHVVITRHEKGPRSEMRMLCESRQELGPFRRATCIGRVPGDEHEIERLIAVNLSEAREYALEASIPARTRPTTLDAETVSLSDDVEIREMRDAPYL